MSASPPSASSSRLRDVVRDGLVLAELLDERLELGQRLGVLPVLGRVALHLGRAEQAHQLFVALFDGVSLSNMLFVVRHSPVRIRAAR